MSTLRTRARDQLPSVLLTLLSIIQALALELFWSRLVESRETWIPGWIAVLGWLQMAVMLASILLIWLFYTTMVMRFVWTPAIRDLLLPFAIGILEFTMIDLLGPDSLGLWFYSLAAAFGLVAWVSHMTYQRARNEPANRDFFSNLSPASLRDHSSTLIAVGGLVLCGVVLQITGNRTWLAGVALIATGALLAQQINMIRRFWNESMSETGS